MPNMSYCRFENTLSALRDCEAYMDDNFGHPSKLSADEEKARKALIFRCVQIAANYGDEVQDDE